MEGNKNLGGSKFDLGILNYLYYQLPLVTDFQPKSGPAYGNSTLTLYGTGFLDANQTASDASIYLRFNNTIHGEYIGKGNCFDIQVGKVQCLTPQSKPDVKSYLEISKNGFDYFPIRNVGNKPEDDIYTFYSAPRVR